MILKRVLLFSLLIILQINILFSQEATKEVANTVPISSKNVFSIDIAPSIEGAFSAVISGYFQIYGAGISYERVINKYVTVGVKTTFIGTHNRYLLHDSNETEIYINEFRFVWDINSKFFFKKKAIVPNGFYIDIGIGGLLVTPGTFTTDKLDYYTGGRFELGWRFLLSSNSEKIKYLIDFAPLGFGVYGLHLLRPNQPLNNGVYAIYSGTLAFSMMF